MKRTFAILAFSLLCLLPLAPVSHAQSAITMQQSSTSRAATFLLVQSSGANAHISPLIGATAIVVISKNGGAFASPAGTVTEIGNGVYKLAPTSADTNTLGTLWVHATALLTPPASAPTLATATTGGTVAAGTYLVAYSFTSAAGETTISPTASITTTGTTSTITVTTASLPGDANGINVYVSTAGGGSGTLTKDGTATTNTTLTAVTTGAAVPGSNTAVAGDPYDGPVNVVAYNPDDSSAMGLTSISNNTATLTKLVSIVPASSTCAAGSTTTSIVTNLTAATTDLYKNELLVFTSGVDAGAESVVTAYNGTTKTLTVSPALPSSPASADAFILVVASPGGSGGGGGDTPGTTTLLSRLPQPVLFDGAGNVKSDTAAYASGEDPASLLFVTPANKLATNSAGGVNLNYTQALDATQLGGTVGGSLVAAWLEGLSKWVIVGTPGTAGAVINEYSWDGTTILKHFDISTAGSRQ
jgi:hypothetical protein